MLPLRTPWVLLCLLLQICLGTAASTVTAPTARYHHSLTPLNQDASSFLLFGGSPLNQSDAVVPFPAYLFDNHQLQFTKLADANSQPALTQDSGHPAVLLQKDGPILLYLSGLLYTYSSTGVWSQISAPGQTPVARSGASSASNGAGIMYMLGNSVASDSLWALDEVARTWSAIALPSGLTGNIVGHRMAFARGQLFVFGGTIDGVYNTKLFAFDTNSGQWASPITVDATVARAYHSMTAVADRYLVIIGGQTTAMPNGSADVIIYDISAKSFKKVSQTTGSTMAPRFAHTAFWDPIRAVVSIWGGASTLADSATVAALSTPMGLAGVVANNGHYKWYALDTCASNDCSSSYMVSGQTDPAAKAARHLALLIILVLLGVLLFFFLLAVFLFKTGLVTAPAWLAFMAPKMQSRSGHPMAQTTLPANAASVDVVPMVPLKKGKADVTVKDADAMTIANVAASERHRAPLPAIPIPAASAPMSDTSSTASSRHFTMMQSPAALEEEEEDFEVIALETDPKASFRTLAEADDQAAAEKNTSEEDADQHSVHRSVSQRSRASTVSVASVQDYGGSNQSTIQARSRSVSALGPYRMVSTRRKSISAFAASSSSPSTPLASDVTLASTEAEMPTQQDERPASSTDSVITVLHEKEASPTRTTLDDEVDATTTMLDDVLQSMHTDDATETTTVEDGRTLDDFLAQWTPTNGGQHASSSTAATMLTVPDMASAMDLEETQDLDGPETEEEDEDDVAWSAVPGAHAPTVASPAIAAASLPLPPSPVASLTSDGLSLAPTEASDVQWVRVDGSIDPPRPEEAFRNLMRQLEAKQEENGSS